MTIAISMKINDGLVLAADSASTMMGQDLNGNLQVINIYNNANKVFNLIKGSPVGAITWGAGSIGHASISTLVKDFRTMLTDKSNEKYYVDTHTLKVENVANKFKEFIYDENYVKAFENHSRKPQLGFMIAGYSSGELLPEEWKIDIDQNGSCNGPALQRRKEDTGMTWNGEPEAITRLYLGFGNSLPQILAEVGVEKDKIKDALERCKQKLAIPMVVPAMPIQDAIDLAEFLVKTTIQFSRFAPGASTVGGPIEIAAITKHEHFKWVKRKHYYGEELNRGETE